MDLTTKIKVANTMNSTGIKVMKIGAGLVLVAGAVAIGGAVLQDSCQSDLEEERRKIREQLSNND